MWREKEKSSNSNGSRKRASGEVDLDNGRGDDVSDTTSSPIKPIPEVRDKQEAVAEVKKKLDVAVDAQDFVPPPPPAYIPPRERKRSKKYASGTGVQEDDDSMAGSLEECRHTQ